MPATTAAHEFEKRLFLEEICCNVCRFLHARRDGAAPEAVRIDQEVRLGPDRDAFADIYVRPPAQPAYAVEVKYGYPRERLLESIRRKYGANASALPADLTGLVLVIDADRRADWPDLESAITASVHPGLTLDIWSEARLIDLVRELFDAEIDSLSEDDLLDAREAIDRAKGVHAFCDDRTDSPLEASLLWHFGFWRLRQLRDAHGLGPRAILPPGVYRDVAVLVADLTSFSGYVRDTPDRDVVRDSLEAFYAKSRYQIINAGGMLYQFVGDGVLAFFGAPDRPAGYLSAALECAESIASIGRSVMREWQRQIDRAQVDAGVHAGMAVGDVQLFSQRPFGRAHMGAVGDPVNMAARLCSVAQTSELVVSNTYYQRLDQREQGRFRQVDAIEAKNVGRIRAWTTTFGR